MIKESKEYFFVKLQNFSEDLNIYNNEECTEILGQINNKSFSLENKNINLDGKYSNFIETLKNLLQQDSILPLRVEYKKRIIINIKRNAQTTQSTKAEFSMSIDNQIINTAYILERPSPDCITPNIELRIPEGIYNVAWHISKDKHKNHTLKLYNHYIPREREILIHSGKYPQNSQGCLLLEEKIGVENQLQRGQSIIKKIRNEFKSKAFKEKFDGMPNAASHIMVIIKNDFERENKGNNAQSLQPMSLHFNGILLTIRIKEKEQIKRFSFKAVSGRAEKINDKHYFTYGKERQMLKNEGPIPEGEYYITPLSENIDDGVQEWDKISIWQQMLSSSGKGQWRWGTFAWGQIRIPIQPKTKTLINSQGQSVTRANFFIHGGDEAGSAGCIDLWKNNDEFFKTFLNYVEKYKDEILKNKGKIPLIVKYKDSTKIECDNEIYTKYCKSIDKEDK